jgi:2-polyprenyl-3-methyl-5-hydroxy-6-metoxy-1,4-benzoquinol methylase
MLTRSQFLHRLVNNTPLKRIKSQSTLLARGYFNFLYLRDDPYQVGRRLNAKSADNPYARAFDLLGRFRAKKALEIACGEGLITPYVAARADKVVAFDLSDVAIRRAQQQNQQLANVTFRQSDVRTFDGAPQSYDLVFCSEILYYIERDQLPAAVERVASWVAKGGKLLLIHHRAQQDDERGLALKAFGGKTIHDMFCALPGFSMQTDKTERIVRMTLLERSGT